MSKKRPTAFERLLEESPDIYEMVAVLLKTITVANTFGRLSERQQKAFGNLFATLEKRQKDAATLARGFAYGHEWRERFGPLWPTTRSSG